jgi:hypothetical protein
MPKQKTDHFQVVGFTIGSAAYGDQINNRRFLAPT